MKKKKKKKRIIITVIAVVRVCILFSTSSIGPVWHHGVLSESYTSLINCTSLVRCFVLELVGDTLEKAYYRLN